MPYAHSFEPFFDVVFRTKNLRFLMVKIDVRISNLPVHFDCKVQMKTTHHSRFSSDTLKAG